MAGRTRTTKKLAQRLNRDYFKNLFPIPRWRRYLSYSLVGLGVLWLGWHAAARNQSVYSSGPITSAHAMFALNCTACHAQQAVFGKKVTDQACESCHDGPIHQAQQTITPACAECHLEHKGIVKLAHTSDKVCTDCHSDLKTRSGQVKVAAHINSFSDGHPEFTPLRAGQSDPGTIKFNHAVHLKNQLRGPHGNVDLKCADCHRANGTTEAWPFGQPDVEAKPVSPTNQPNAHSTVSARAYMSPVNYYEACSSCHPLIFDKFIGEPAPHKKPEIVHEFVVKKLQQYITAHPEELRKPLELVAQIPTRPPLPPPHTAAEWVSLRVADAEGLLWRKTCKECHSLQFTNDNALPEVPKANVTARWLQHGEFDHKAHQMVQCASCHTKANTSKETSDVLIPGIKTCQECHHPGKVEAAQSGCFECHQYHDWSKEKHIEGKYTVHQLITEIRGYSYRKDSIGSTPAARRAGT